MPAVVLASAVKRFPEREIRLVLSQPRGAEDNFPRQGVTAVGGFTAVGVPIIVLVDMETNEVFHAQRYEKKFRRLFRW